MNFNNADNIHFIGIGGIGVSALARLALQEGKEVTGSDASESEILTDLRADGAAVSVGHAADNVSSATDLVVYSIAVPPENPELQKADTLNIPAITYPEALGELSKDKNTIAVAGTHGKTTTTAMIAEITSQSSMLDPTVIVGSLLSATDSNCIHGLDNNLVVEACEYKRSFLHLHPDVLVITNIDNDHLDYFDGIADIKAAFSELIEKLPKEGTVITNPTGEHIAAVLAESQVDVVDYTRIQKSFQLQVPGEHAIANAQAAVGAVTELGISQKQAAEYVSAFTGTWRRAEMKGHTAGGALVYDDYAHHPTEIKATLQGFRQQHPEKKMIVVFQPHLYSRTKKLLDEFPPSFAPAERIIILPIYAAREAPDASISAHDLLETLQAAYPDKAIQYAGDFDTAKKHLEGYMTAGNMVATMGAGDVYKLAEMLI